MFTLTEEHYDSFLIVQLNGQVSFEDADDLRQQLEKYLTSPGIQYLVLDLAVVETINPAGMGAIVAANARAHTINRPLYLYRPAPHILQMMTELEIDGLFPFLGRTEDLLLLLPE